MAGRGIRSSSEAWLRGELTLQDGVLLLNEDSTVPYHPETRPALLWEFQAIVTDEDALRFAGRYGLLRTKPPQALREPVVAWHAEVALVHGALGLQADLLAVQEGVDGAMDDMRDRWLETRGGTDTVLDDDAVLEEAREALLRAVARGLEGTQITLEANGGGGFVLVPRPRNLLGLIYHRLAETVANGDPVRRCRECESLFLAEDRRQRYCSERHASRARLRRFRARAR